ncbi:MAG TPA: hypothetical protein VJC21_02360 [Candidatus Nanoarchaeia archaeon]|nr:hypothetical protein [Candidatus Nanoarchaeia archaeon]
MNNVFPTYEVGSLPKLNARVKAAKGQPVSGVDLEELRHYAQRLSIPCDAVIGLFERQNGEQRALTAEEKSIVTDFNSLFNLRLQEQLGLDFVYDGEARRTEMYHHVVRHVKGFELAPEMTRSRGPDSWRMGICIAPPSLKEGSLPALVTREFDFATYHAARPVKVPLDDPYMIAVMSDNRYYTELVKSQAPAASHPRQLRYEAKQMFTLALAENVIRPQVQALVERGAQWIQLDVPAATLDLEHLPIMVAGINAVVAGIENVKFSIHVCYPRRVSLTEKQGYDLLFPHVLKLHPAVNHFSLELANADHYEQDLAVFKQHQDQRRFEIGIGVVDITQEQQVLGRMETPEIVRQRILRAATVLGDPQLVFVAPDCGLRQLQLERCIQLYETMVEGAALARKG